MVGADVANVFGVQGRFALVTGDSSGFGYMIAQARRNGFDTRPCAEMSSPRSCVEWL